MLRTSRLMMLALSVSIFTFSYGQVKFYAVVSEEVVRFNQTFQVQFIIEGAHSVENFRIPDLKDFLLEDSFAIPHATTVNPQTLQVRDSYSKILVLSPKKAGVLLIPSAVATINGTPMHSNSISIVVSRGSFSMPGYDHQEEIVEDESELMPGESPEEKIRRNLFLQTLVNKKSCYVGEAILAIYKACSRLNASSHVVKRPSLTGFSVIEMVDTYDNEPEIEKINGKPFYTHLIRKVQLFPLQAGHYDLDGAEVESVVHFLRNMRSESGSDQLFRRSTDYQPFEHKTVLTSSPVSIMVKPLPDDGQPANFSGAVGRFTANAKMKELVYHKGDIARYELTVSGTGNFPLITAPQVSWPSSIELVQVTAIESLHEQVYPLQGQKKFEFLLAIKDTGQVTIPTIHFSFFDPETKAYQTQTVDSLSLRVLPAIPVTTSTSKPDTGSYGALMWLAGAGVVIMLGLLFLVSRRQRRPEPTIVAEPVDIVHDLLRPCRVALKKNDPSTFYGEIENILWHLIEERFSLKASELNKPTLLVDLKDHLPSAAIKELIFLLNECEWSRYTPGEVSSDLDTMYRRTENLVNELIQ